MTRNDCHPYGELDMVSGEAPPDQLKLMNPQENFPTGTENLGFCALLLKPQGNSRFLESVADVAGQQKWDQENLKTIWVLSGNGTSMICKKNPAKAG